MPIYLVQYSKSVVLCLDSAKSLPIYVKPGSSIDKHWHDAVKLYNLHSPINHNACFIIEVSV